MSVHVLDWPIGLNTSAVESGTRLYVPKEEVAEPYWRGMHRVFGDTDSPQGSALRFAQGDVGDVLVRLSTTPPCWSSGPMNRSTAGPTSPAQSVITASATQAVRWSRFQSQFLTQTACPITTPVTTLVPSPQPAGPRHSVTGRICPQCRPNPSFG